MTNPAGVWSIGFAGSRACGLQPGGRMGAETGTILASISSQELLGMGSVSRAPSPRCFASRRERVVPY